MKHASRALGVACAVTLLLALGGAEVARADVGGTPGDGWHEVSHEAWVDLGIFVDCVTWRYVVQENETLGEIAQRELGSAQRHREILALNAGLTPKGLRANQRIVMPPRPAACKGRGPKWVFFAWSPDENGWAAPRQLVEGARHQVSHGARLYAVPAVRLQAVLGKATENGLDGRVLEREEGVARSGIVTLVASLPDVDPTRRIVTEWRVQSVADGRVALVRLGEDRFGDGDRLLVSSNAPSSGHGTLLLGLTFLLMVAGLGWTVARAQRLRPVDAAVPVWDEDVATSEAEDLGDDEEVEEDEELEDDEEYEEVDDDEDAS